MQVALAAEDTDAKGATPAPSKADPPSKLAPPVGYLEIWAFLHGKDPTLPKVLYVPKVPEDGEEASAAPPSWLTSVAMAYKDGRKYTAKFAVVTPTDAVKVAKRFGLDGDQLPLLVALAPGGAVAHRLPNSELRLGGGTTVRAVKTLVASMIADELSDEAEGGIAMPSFPEPTRPRKQASASLEEFTHESLPLNCYAGERPLCVLAVIDQPSGQGCPDAMAELSKRFRNDKTIAFGCVGAARQDAFLSGMALAKADLPALVAVKGGKRPRAARMAGTIADDVTPLAAFVDALLGGGATFSRLADGLPELEAPYLLDSDKDEM